MIKYRFTGKTWDPKITKEQVLKETRMTITFEYELYDGSKRTQTEYKNTAYIQWFDTFEQAKEYAISIYQSKIDRLNEKVESTTDSLEKIKAWKDE